MSSLAIGQIIEAEVTSAENFGIFCRLHNESILVLIPDISWVASFASCDQVASPGERFEMTVVCYNESKKTYRCSIRDLYPNPWLSDSFASGTVLTSRVLRLVAHADRCDGGPGYLVELLPGSLGMMRMNGESLNAGQVYDFVVTGSDASDRSVRLALAH